jgi:hypothetical protein
MKITSIQVKNEKKIPYLINATKGYFGGLCERGVFIVYTSAKTEVSLCGSYPTQMEVESFESFGDLSEESKERIEQKKVSFEEWIRGYCEALDLLNL